VPERHLLIVSYYFPPDSAVGGLRLGKFARCLPEFGWRPYVLTVDDEHRDQGLDAERMRGLERVTIVRSYVPPSVLPLLVAWRGRLRRRPAAGASPEASSPVAPGSAPEASSAPGRETAVERLRRYAASMVMLMPDDKKKWAVSASLAAVRIVRARGIDCVLTSSPPASLHLAGLVAKTLTGVPWVADLRDPWLETVLHERPAADRSRASDWIEGWMEKVVMTRADKVITTTARLRDALRARYPTVPPERFVNVPNSIDTEKFQTDDQAKYEPLTITYAGTLYIDRTPEPLFRAVSALIRSGAATPSDIRIKLVGNCRTVNGVETRAIAAKYGIETMVEILDFASHSAAIRMMQKSHLLLVLAPDHHRHIVPAKVYDYLGSGTPVLALAEEGATRDIVAETDCGRCFSLKDIAGLTEYLRYLLEDRQYRQLRNDPARFADFDVRRLTGRLAAELPAGNNHGRPLVARA
jgi:glycosyltransferase involved in cell wall biosynthesis